MVAKYVPRNGLAIARYFRNSRRFIDIVNYLGLYLFMVVSLPEFDTQLSLFDFNLFNAFVKSLPETT